MRRLLNWLALNLELGAAIAQVLWSRLRKGPKRPGWSFAEELVSTGMQRVFRRIDGRPWPQQRETFAVLAIPAFAVRGVTIERSTLAGRPATWITPSGLPEGAPTIFFLHGGAYLFGAPEEYVEFLARLTKAARARAVAIDYRLAPEHPFPAAQEDALAAYRAFLGSGVKPERLVIAGDSAGGGLTTSLLVAARDAGLPLPRCALLIVPWVDLAATGGSMESNAPFDVFTPAMVAGWAKTVTQGSELSDPRISVVNAELRGLPPLLIQVGGLELILDQVRAFAERARAAGVDVTLRVWDGCVHDWAMYSAVLPKGRAAVVELGEYVRARLSG